MSGEHLNRIGVASFGFLPENLSFM